MTSRILIALLLLARIVCVQAELVRSQTDDVVVTGTRFTERPQDIVIAVDVINRQQLDDAAGRSLPELLQQMPGISVRDFFGNYSSSSVLDLRGFGASAGPNTVLLLDGRRIRDIDFSGVQWPSIALDSLARVEIIRGGGSVLYGDGAVGGVVNLITRTPFDRSNGASIRAERGTYGSREASVSANVLGDDVGLSLHGNRVQSDGYRLNNENRVSNAGAVLEWMDDRWHSLVSAGEDHQDLRLPGARTVNPANGLDELADARRGTATPKDYSSHDGQYVNLELNGNWDDVTTGMSLGYRNKRDLSYYDFGGFPDYRQVDLDSINISPRAKLNWDASSVKQSLVIGADYYAWNYHLSRSDSPLNVVRPINSVTARQTNFAAYVWYTLQPSLTDVISVGRRDERQHMTVTDTFDAGAPGGSFGSAAPPGIQVLREYADELGWRHDFSTAFAATARYARAYRFATVDEIYESGTMFTNEFQFLRPQNSSDVDLGIELRDRASLTKFTLFDIELRDEIHLDPFFTGIGNTNLPRSRRRGLEWESQWIWTKGERLLVAYSYTRAQFMDGNLSGTDLTGREVPLVSRHKGNIAWNHQLTEASRLGVRAQYVGTRRMDNDEGNLFPARIPAYTLMDASITFERAKWTLGLSVNNLTNRKYYDYAVTSVTTAGKYNAYPLPERAILLSASYRFEK